MRPAPRRPVHGAPYTTTLAAQRPTAEGNSPGRPHDAAPTHAVRRDAPAPPAHPSRSSDLPRTSRTSDLPRTAPPTCHRPLRPLRDAHGPHEPARATAAHDPTRPEAPGQQEPRAQQLERRRKPARAEARESGSEGSARHSPYLRRSLGRHPPSSTRHTECGGPASRSAVPIRRRKGHAGNLGRTTTACAAQRSWSARVIRGRQQAAKALRGAEKAQKKKGRTPTRHVPGIHGRKYSPSHAGRAIGRHTWRESGPERRSSSA